MKKLALCMLLSIAAPLFAVISDAEYAKEVEKEMQQNVPAIIFEQEPLHYFVVRGNLPAVQYLIEVKKVDINQKVNNMTSLELAAYNGQNEIVKYLLERGAKQGNSSMWGIHRSQPEATEILEYYTPKTRL